VDFREDCYNTVPVWRIVPGRGRLSIEVAPLATPTGGLADMYSGKGKEMLVATSAIKYENEDASTGG